MFSDYFNLALRTFKHKPTRSWLTIIGIFIGIAAVVALISLGQGLQDAVNKQFEMLGTNKITIYPGQNSFGVIGAIAVSERLSDRDLSKIQSVKGVEKATGIALTIAKVQDKGKPIYAIITGYEPNEINMKDFMGATAKDGRELKSNDGYKVMVGYDLKYGNVFEKPVEVGDKLTIAGKTFTVVGVVDKIGNPGFDRRLYIVRDVYYEVFKQEGYPMILAISKDGYDPAAVAADIKEKLRKDRGLEKGKENFSVVTSDQMKKIASNIVGIIQIIVVGIAAISLLVGGIGIMNTMYTSVLERTREIGIMKAVGARNNDIAMIFLIESGLLGLIGGILGVTAGVWAAVLVEYISSLYNLGLKASYGIELIVGSLVFAFLVGCISGLVPALQAAKMKPAESLRYE
jgi:putative ABC transport system permease protein